jgi:DNA-binding CsgD family transcriptional regulator
VSIDTIKTHAVNFHIVNVLGKFGVDSRTQAVSVVLQRRLTDWSTSTARRRLAT